MKANEIRIGNWFHYPGLWSYRQPEGAAFSKFDFQWEDRDWFAVGESLLFLEEVLPIPLTEEWLVRMGFEKKKGWNDNEFYELSAGETGIEITWDKNGVYLIMDDQNDHLPHVQYVHQVQNLYFSLTGEELTIKE